MPDGVPEEVAVNTAKFTEEDGRSTLTILVQHTSKEFRDGHVRPPWPLRPPSWDGSGR